MAFQLSSMHSDAKTVIHRTDCDLSSPSTSVDVKQSQNSCHHILDFYAFSHSCHWLNIYPLYFHSYNAYCCLVKPIHFVKGIRGKNTSKTSLDLITTVFS
jgi:hypothetical protein